MNENTQPTLNDFPLTTYEKLRYRDTDRQGHVNNAVFSSCFETGRVELLYNPNEPLASEGGSFVIARITMDFLNEVNWPGEVHIGTRVAKVGRSSMNLEQVLFQNEKPVARADTVIVQMDNQTRKSKPLSESTIAKLSQLIVE